MAESSVCAAPPPPPPPVPQLNTSSAFNTRSALLDDIRKGATLKKAPLSLSADNVCYPEKKSLLLILIQSHKSPPQICDIDHFMLVIRTKCKIPSLIRFVYSNLFDISMINQTTKQM